MVNRRSFELDYEIESVGGSGIAKVELWGTRDGGAHWQRFGRDDDNRSPILVTVDAEGLYGFRVVVESGNGMSSDPPRDGDLPEVWINVDLDQAGRPHYRRRRFPRTGRSDDPLGCQRLGARIAARVPLVQPDSRPVPGPRSPRAWRTAAASSGGSTPTCREQIYLKLEVRDEAGNVGSG